MPSCVYQGFYVIVACGSVKTYGVLALYVDRILYPVYILNVFMLFSFWINSIWNIVMCKLVTDKMYYHYPNERTSLTILVY